ncbi:MAG TPA: SDR family NAD(P)-dependent oxidoreductase [Acidimicrobiia bacterium]|nr:SDR family NAD(P)-dependent oxidoreductase [Acidimicrobiia bacterium]
MEQLHNRVAVVTGGGGGLGRAMGERFASEGMKVVLADVRPEPLDATVAELCARGLDVTGVVADVSSWESIENLRDRALDAYGAVHLLCNNAGIGVGAEGRVWEHEINDWRWAIGVNLYGVIHGINAFVPHMLEHGEPGHVVNTSSGNGGITPILGTPEYSVTKGAVVTLTEVLGAQLEDAGAAIGASVLFPGPHMLRTGLFDAWRHRPADLAKSKPRSSAPVTLEQYEQIMRDAGMEVQFTAVEEVAGRVVDAIRAGEFWILPHDERTDEQVRAKADSLLKRENPRYVRAVAG